MPRAAGLLSVDSAERDGRPVRPWRTRLRAATWVSGGAAWWVLVPLGLLLATAGALLVVRPLSAVAVIGFYTGASCVLSGAADLLSARGTTGLDADATGPPDASPRRGTAWLDRFAPWLWIVVGLLVIVWLGRRPYLLTTALGVLLVVTGLASVVRLAFRPSFDRVVGGVFGLAQLVFGLLALLWPHATLIVVAALFGGRTVVFGLALVVQGIRGGRQERQTQTDEEPREALRRNRIGRLAAAGAVLVLAVATGWVSHSLRSGAPVLDSFYDTPSQLPSEPGTLIRYDAYRGFVPAGLTAYRIYYTTTDEQGRVVPSSGVLAVPSESASPAPLVTWAHGTVGVARACAPSLADNAFALDSLPAVDLLADLGWAMVATDYPGMGAQGAFPYLIGQGEGRAVLDAARAARQVPRVSLGQQTVVWGHSQGGHGALWAGQLAASYAPDLDVVGTAAISPAADPMAMARSVLAHPDALGASLAVSYVVDSYTTYYDGLDVDAVVAPSARSLVREAASRCTGQGGTLVTVLAGLSVARDQPIVRDGAVDGPFGTRLTANVAHGPWGAPVFIGQGNADEVVPFRLTTAYVGQLCAAGQPLEFRSYAGDDHMSVLARGSRLNSDLVAWTTDRLAGKPAADTCRR